MPIQLSIQKHNCCRYRELYLITAFVDNSVFKTQHIGHIRYEDEPQVISIKNSIGLPKYAVSAISTKISSNEAVNPVINLFKLEEL